MDYNETDRKLIEETIRHQSEDMLKYFQNYHMRSLIRENKILKFKSFLCKLIGKKKLPKKSIRCNEIVIPRLIVVDAMQRKTKWVWPKKNAKKRSEI